MKKRLTAILLCLAMLLALAGCQSEKKDTPVSNQPQTDDPSTDKTDGDAKPAAPEKIVFAYMTNNNIPETEDLLRIQKLINDYTIEKINTEVELLLIAQSDYSTQINLMLASDQQVDIYRAMNGYPQQD
ncbi:MAG: hypothetical protein K2P04_11590, partial [Oscillospiraceae bacterium]|nr:hypothetical protein [Oscillospiraceae bacterium]